MTVITRKGHRHDCHVNVVGKGPPGLRALLFSFLDGLLADTEWRYWIGEHVIEVNICDIGKDMGPTVKEVKIALPMSHNSLTIAEEHIQW
jgi:hypothetical protein